MNKNEDFQLYHFSYTARSRVDIKSISMAAAAAAEQSPPLTPESTIRAQFN